MSQELEKNSNQVNIDSSSNSTVPQEEKKYAFNQAEVNTNQTRNENQNPYGGNNNSGQQPTNQWQGQPGANGQPNNQWQGQWGGNGQPNNGWQGQPGGNGQPNNGWQGQPGRNGQPNNGWQGQPGANGQPNNGWQGQPRGNGQPNNQWQGQWNGNGQPNNGWQGQPGANGQPNTGWQGQPGQNQQWQRQNGPQYSERDNQRKQASVNPFKLFNEQQVKVPKIKTNEDARNVYFGVNQDYYNKVYKEYKQGKKISWNWSAFIFRSYWFFSRKMYAIGALYTLMMSFISYSVYQISQNITNPQILVMAFPWAVAFFGLWASAGMFGNYMYMAHMENKIVYPSDKSGSAEQITQLNVMRGGFSVYGIILCFMATDLILTVVQYIAGML